MKVLHGCSCYFPDRGGSETYTSELAAGLQRRGVANLMVSATEPPALFDHAGIRVARLGGSMADFPTRFAALLDEEKPDVLHLHTRSTIWNHSTIEVVHARDIPVVLTYHIATISCRRGDLMRHGTTVCSGELRSATCVACVAAALGAPRILAKELARTPQWVGRAANVLPEGKLRTALQLRDSVAGELAEIACYLKSCSRIVVLADWTRQLLLRNGVLAERIFLSRVGTHHLQPAPATRTSSRVLRGIYVGRLHPSKGVGLVAQALNRCCDLPLQIDVYGAAAVGDIRLSETPQLRCRGTLKDTDVVSTFSDYDFAIVPSQIPETGPFTVVEALQAGVPVIGSDMAAINELITHEANGLLVAPGSVDAWERVFRRLCAEPTLLPALRQATGYKRTMQDVADEMLDVYQAVLREQ